MLALAAPLIAVHHRSATPQDQGAAQSPNSEESGVKDVEIAMTGPMMRDTRPTPVFAGTPAAV